MLVRQQIAGINSQAEKLERDADALDAERDVLEHERDSTKAALAKASKRSGFSVLPYKGPNGTWRRPIVIECTRGGANLQPHGPTFTALELSPRINPKSSTFIRAIARELFTSTPPIRPTALRQFPISFSWSAPTASHRTTLPVRASSLSESRSATSSSNRTSQSTYLTSTI